MKRSIIPLTGMALCCCISCLGEDFSDVPVIDTHIHLYDTTRPEGLRGLLSRTRFYTAPFFPRTLTPSQRRTASPRP